MSTASTSQTAPVWAYPPDSALSSVTPANGEPPNMAAIWLRAGQVPLERIVMQPAPGTATVDDAVNSRHQLNLNCELVDGILVAKPMGYFESKIAAILIYILYQHLDSHPIGEVAGGDGPCKTLPDHARKPDASFTSFERLRQTKKPIRKTLPFSPDLAVEVLSPSNTAAEMNQKFHEYFATGARLVWLIEPELQTARAYTSPTVFEDIPPTGALHGREVLPGFELPLEKLF